MCAAGSAALADTFDSFFSRSNFLLAKNSFNVFKSLISLPPCLVFSPGFLVLGVLVGLGVLICFWSGVVSSGDLVCFGGPGFLVLGGGSGRSFSFGSAIVGCGLYSWVVGVLVTGSGSGVVVLGVDGLSGMVRGGLSLGGAMEGIGLYFGWWVVFSGVDSCLGKSGLFSVWVGVV